MSSTLTRLQLKNFTAFDDLDIRFSPGVNVFIGENGTGKTHLLKLLYAACDITHTRSGFGEKLRGVFRPHLDQIGRLARRTSGSINASIVVHRTDAKLTARFSNHTKSTGLKVEGTTHWHATRIRCTYIPVKEMLAHAPGFRSLFEAREIAFEDIYRDIIDRAYTPRLRGPIGDRKRLLNQLAGAIEGEVVTKGEVFFLSSSQGQLEFSLVAEGIRKLALLWLLIQNGILTSGTMLFWDEPEANLNPKKVGEVVQVLLELQRAGVQVFVATHDYVVLKEFDLRRESEDDVQYHALYRDEQQRVRLASTCDYSQIDPNAISDTFMSLYDRDIERSLDKDRSS